MRLVWLGSGNPMSNNPQANDYASNQSYRVERPVGSHLRRHGRPSSWVIVAVVLAAFVTGAFAIVFRLWPLFWVCVGIFVLSVPAGKVLGIMNDTVGVEEPFDEENKPAADQGTSAQPGVRVK
ncbi:MAG TPA: hypothetical protein VMU95_02720 [Trebonia sp.]|nr:hypothetical protein [Trebonia sp.]